MTREAYQETRSVKVDGLRNMLAAVATDRLKFVTTFGSIIAQTGLAGEADYALANAELAYLMADLAGDLRDCRCLNIEWSVWAGAGMAERLGRVEALSQQGVSPISIEAGVEAFLELLQRSDTPASCVVTGRYGELPTRKCEEQDLPFLRFLETPEVHYPGIELITRSTLSLDSDPYLADHEFEGKALLPGVIGLEAVAQVAQSLAEEDRRPQISDVKFARPITLTEDGRASAQIAALRRGADRVDVAVRCDATAFAIDHFTACCRFTTAAAGDSKSVHVGGTQCRQRAYGAPASALRKPECETAISSSWSPRLRKAGCSSLPEALTYLLSSAGSIPREWLFWPY
jgi:enediyne polyketide synthase